MFGDIKDFAGGGSYFKPAEYQTALGLLLEPKRVDKDQPHTYRGQASIRDELTADISVFANQADLESGKPSEILKAVKVTQKVLVADAAKAHGGGVSALAVTIAKTPTKGGEAFVWRPAPPDVAKVIENYYTARGEAAAQAPSFDD